MWRCAACGYIWQGDEAPDVCPKCGAANSRFEEVDAKSADLIHQVMSSDSSEPIVSPNVAAAEGSNRGNSSRNRLV